MKPIYYVGLDVHKETISIAYALGGSRDDATYHGQCGGSVAAAVKALQKLAEKLKIEFRDLKVCYEAGPTGFVLARQLIKKGVDCVLMSPSKTERKPGDKIKTDKRDACNIARLFRNGDITQVRIPPVLDEAVRDVCRARTDATDDLTRAKQRLNAFLLRNGFNYTGKSKWTAAHMRYLRELTMPSDPQRIVLEESIQAIDACENRIERLVTKMKQILETWEWKPIVQAVMAFKGFQEVAAMTLISELGDLRRFDHPRKLMAFIGLVPSEASSGGKKRQGAITKCGNSHCRWMLVECAQHFRKAPRISPALTTRQEGQSEQVKALSWRMQNRLYNRYVKLKARGKTETKIIVAIARELSAFLWELQNKLKLPMPGVAPIAAAAEERGMPHGAAAPNPAELRQLDPVSFPLNPQGDFSPPVPQGSGGKRLKKPLLAKGMTL
jgi:transposase